MFKQAEKANYYQVSFLPFQLSESSSSWSSEAKAAFGHIVFNTLCWTSPLLTCPNSFGDVYPGEVCVQPGEWQEQVDRSPSNASSWVFSLIPLNLSQLYGAHTAIKHQGGASLLLERASLFSSFPCSILVHVKTNLTSLVLGLQPP